jgi:hypothetical protein
MTLQWYDKLALVGLAVAFVGAMMYLIGLGYMLSASRQARADLRASIAQARVELETRH